MQPQNDDELYIETTDIEPGVRRSLLGRLLHPIPTEQRFIGRRKVRSIIVGGIFLALVLMMVLFTPVRQALLSTLHLEPHSKGSNAPSILVSTPIPTPTALLYPTPNLTQSKPLASVPECPSGPQPQDIAPQYFGAAIGNTPIWVVGFVGPHAAIRIDSHNSQYTRYGWASRVIFVIKPGYTNPVTISGQNTANGNPLWIQSDMPTPQVSLYLDPHYPEVPNPESSGGWTQWPSEVFIPEAGCYELHARWAGGSWTVAFAAGS